MLSEGGGELCLVYNETAQSVIISCITLTCFTISDQLRLITRVECYSNEEGGGWREEGVGGEVIISVSCHLHQKYHFLPGELEAIRVDVTSLSLPTAHNTDQS